MTKKATPGLLGTVGVADLLGVHPKHVFRLLKRGLPGHRLGGEWRFDSSEVLAWLRAGSPAAVDTNVKHDPPELPPLLAANGDVCVELLMGALTSASRSPFGLVQADSTSGRAYVERGSVLAAGVHGNGVTSTDALLRIHVTRRSVCLAYAKGKRVRSVRAAAGLRVASRPVTAGVRAHFDRALRESGLDPESVHENALLCGSHRDVALSLLSGRADVGIVTLAWAERAGLASLPLADEDYALSLRADALEHEHGRVLVRTLQSTDFKRLLSRTAGYEPRAAGTLL